MTKQEFINELSKLRPSSTFLSLSEYKNQFGEVSNYNIVFHIDYQKSLKKSIQILSTYQAKSDMESLAKREVLEEYNRSLIKMENTPIQDIDDNYKRFFDQDKKCIKGIKMHQSSGILYLFGYIHHRVVIVSGNYPDRNQKPLTICKESLRKLTPVHKFRQFKITKDNVKLIKVEHLTLIPPGY